MQECRDECEHSWASYDDNDQLRKCIGHHRSDLFVMIAAVSKRDKVPTKWPADPGRTFNSRSHERPSTHKVWSAPLSYVSHWTPLTTTACVKFTMTAGHKKDLVIDIPRDPKCADSGGRNIIRKPSNLIINWRSTTYKHTPRPCFVRWKHWTQIHIPTATKTFTYFLAVPGDLSIAFAQRLATST